MDLSRVQHKDGTQLVLKLHSLGSLQLGLKPDMFDTKEKFLMAALWILSALLLTSVLPGSIMAIHKHRPCI